MFMPSEPGGLLLQTGSCEGPVPWLEGMLRERQKWGHQGISREAGQHGTASLSCYALYCNPHLRDCFVFVTQCKPCGSKRSVSEIPILEPLRHLM